MSDDLPANGKPRGKSMRIPITGEKQQLEDKNADRPNRGCAAKKGRNSFPSNN